MIIIKTILCEMALPMSFPGSLILKRDPGNEVVALHLRTKFYLWELKYKSGPMFCLIVLLFAFLEKK